MKNDELDAATVERCAQVAERWLESSWRDEVFAAKSIASAIRSLIPNLQGEGEPVVKQVPSPAGTASDYEVAQALWRQFCPGLVMFEKDEINYREAARALLSQFDVRRK